MQQLNAQLHGIPKTESAMRYLTIRLRSRPESREMATSIKDKRVALRSAYDAYQDALEERQAMTAEIVYRDGLVNGGVMKVSRHGHTMVDGKRDDARFKRLFPKAPSVMIAPVGGEEQEKAVRGLIKRISESDDYADLRPMAEELDGLLVSLKEAEEARKDLYITEGNLRVEFEIALDDAHRTYNLTYHRLKLAYPDDNALVESFFKTLTIPGKSASAESEDPGVGEEQG